MLIKTETSMRPRLLDLFCGGGGAGEGYRRAGYIPTGVDIEYQKNYPYEFRRCDALEYLERHGHEFDVIHASPPCQFYSQLTPTEYRADHPDMIALVSELLVKTGKPYVIENVAGARKHLKNPLMLCGSMFRLGVWRHRYFEINPTLWFAPATCCHDKFPVLISGTNRRKGVKRFEYKVAECRIAADIGWMTRAELDESIPPAYTEWIGRQLMPHVLATMGQE